MSYKKLAVLSLILAVGDFLFIPYQWIRCTTTQASYYCDFFAFGLFLYFIGIPTLILLIISVISFARSTSLRPASSVMLIFLTVITVVVFIIPYLPVFSPNFKSYRE